MILLAILNMSLKCPKCGGFSWIEFEGEDAIQNCVCGLHKWLRREIGGDIITRSPIRQGQVSMPERGTQLSQILGCLVALGQLSSGQIALQLSISVDKASTNLSVLRKRGLVEVVTDRKGQAGGSLWSAYPIVIQKYHRR